MGRARKPTKLLEIRGSRWAKRPLEPTPAVETTIPTPPSWLDRKARKYWQQLCAQLVPLGMLTATDHAALALFADTLLEYVETTRAVAKTGRYLTTDKGNTIQHPAVGVVHKSRDQLLKLAREFGLTPASRSLVASGKPRAGAPETKGRFFKTG